MLLNIVGPYSFSLNSVKPYVSIVVVAVLCMPLMLFSEEAHSFISDSQDAGFMSAVFVVLGIVVLAVALMALAWLWRKSLQQRVDIATAQLQQELDQHIKAEQALLISQKRYATLFDAADDGLFLIHDNITVDCNKAAADLLGCTRMTLINKSPFTWSASYQPDGFDSADKAIDLLDAVMTGESQSLEWIFKRQDGEEFVADLSLARCDTSDKLYILMVVRDISERKRIEALKDEFISTVSHEIRTPLTSILGSLKLVLSGELKGGVEQITPMLSIAHNNAERLLSLVNDLLDIQKLASKHSQLSYADTNLADFLRQSIDNNQGYAARYNVNLVLDDISDCYYALVDQGRLMQVMNNLLSNAAKFSHNGGCVEIKNEVIGFMLRISVVDHGVGIPDEFHAHVFERFTQADSTSTRQVGGTGLGLNIAQSIIEQHGGHMGFTSKSGEGTTFYFDIPFENRHQESQVS